MLSAAAFTFLDENIRPVSLGSLEFMRLMGLELFTPGAQWDTATEARQIAAFQWLHTAPLAEVRKALWDGGWQLAFHSVPVVPVIIASFRVDRDRVMKLIEEASVRVRRKPGDKGSETPAEVLRPSMYTHRLMVLMESTHQPREQLEWHTPADEALRMYHCAMWSQGSWTVKAASEPVSEDDFEDFDLPPAEQDD